jgi:hypothetical protein
MTDSAADRALDPASIVKAFERTAVRPQMSLDEAIACQFRLVDAVQRVMGSDDVFVEDAGQDRSLAAVDFGGGGRPVSTARVEEVLASFFEAEAAALVHGAGTGAIRAMLDASVESGETVLLHNAPPYKTTVPAMRHMGLRIAIADFNAPDALRAAARAERPAAVYVQYVPQQLGDTFEMQEVVVAARDAAGDDVRVLVDDNYAVMRCARIGVQLGADASAFSLFKLLAPANIGCVVGRAAIVDGIRRDLASAGCQVQGHDAMEALRSLAYAPVALAIQDRVVRETAGEIDRLIAGGELPHVRAAVAAQPGIRCVVLVFDAPVAEDFLRSAWRNGSPSRSVGEEARHELIPLFTYLTRTFLRAMPGLERYAIRVNPLRGGPETVLRVLRAALDDPEFRDAAERSTHRP